MKSRTTIVLGLICLGLLLYVYLGVWKNPGTTELQKNSREILSFKGDEIVRVELKNSTGNYTFTKKAGGWSIEKPITSPANTTPISTLLSELDFGRRMDTIATSASGDIDSLLEKYGLKDPRLRLDLKTSSASEIILIGRPTAVAGAVYALLQTEKGREIVALDQQIENLLSKNLDEWRSRDIFSINTASITSLVLHNKGQDAEVKKENNTWKISKPVVAGADETQIHQLLADLQRFRILRFVSEDNAAQGSSGLNTPSMVLEISEGDKPITLSIGLPDTENANAVYAMVSGRTAIFTIPKEVTQLMGEFLNRVRDRRIVNFDDPANVKSMSFTYRGTTVDIERESSQSPNWKIKGRSETVDGQKIDFLLRGLQRTKVSNFSVAGDPETLLKNPLASMKITKEDGDAAKNTEELFFVSKTKDEVIIRTSLQPSLVMIPSVVFDNIPQSITGWFSLNVFGLNPSEIKSLSWKNGSETYDVTHVAETHSWNSSTGNQTLDLETLELQLKVLNQLSAVRWNAQISKKELSSKPLLILQVKRGETTDTLTFFHELKDQTVVARLNEQEYSFIVSQRDFQVLKLKPFKTSETSGKANP